MGWLKDKLIGPDESGWYVDPNPRRVLVYVDSEENCVHDKWFRERYWRDWHSMFSMWDNYWMYTAEEEARTFADNVRTKGLTINGVAYPAHRIHKVVIEDYEQEISPWASNTFS
jgi:hypothetical protein